MADSAPVIAPVHFFALSFECARFAPEDPLPSLFTKRYLVPDTSFLCVEERFAEVYMGWNEEELILGLRVPGPYDSPAYPRLQEGDCFEAFINTRTATAPGSPNRFCHHFYLLGRSVEGRQAAEITRFRTDDAHPLCDESQLKVDSQKSGRHHQIVLKIPALCLVGYEPDAYGQIGFTYRVNRASAPPQHFAACTKDFSFDAHPALWAHVRLVS